MASAIGSILRQSQKYKKLNILSYPTHERQNSMFSDINAHFYLWWSQGIKTWNSKYGTVPRNFTILNSEKGENQIPPDLEFDCILSQNKFDQYQVAKQLSRKLHLPMIQLEHTLPVELWPKEQLRAMKEMKGDINIFISDYSREKWGWKADEAIVIKHAMNTDLFNPGNTQRIKRILTVANDYVNRDYFLGFSLYKNVIENLPALPIGDTPGLSKAADSIEELITAYQTSQIFLNTSQISPIPCAMLEAMACGCAIVSTNNCMIPEWLEHEYNAYLTNDAKTMKKYLIYLLENEEECIRIGHNARKTIMEKGNLDRYVQEWNAILEKIIKIPYKG